MARSSGSMFNANPALKSGFSRRDSFSTTNEAPMTMSGTVLKTALMLAVLVTSATFAYVLNLSLAIALPLGLAAFVIAIVTAFKPHLAKPLGLVYAVGQGVVVGTISNYYANAFEPGIVLTAAMLTIGILTALLLVYSTGLIKPSQNFKLGVAAATGGIALFYLATIALSFFGIQMPLVSSNSGFGIAFSVFVVLLASANLVVDFDFIEEGVERKLPAHMEWYGALGLIISLVWLFLEVLRLISKLQSR